MLGLAEAAAAIRRGAEADQQRLPGAPDHARVEVAAGLVRAEPVRERRRLEG